MSNEKTEWKQLAKFISYDVKNLSKKEGEEFNKIIIKYTQPNSKDPAAEWSVGILEKDAEDALIDKIASLEAGTNFGVWTGKDDSGYNILKGIIDVKDLPAKSGKGGSYDKKPYDDTAVSVGQAYNMAPGLMGMVGGMSFKTIKEALDKVDEVVDQILERKKAKEDQVRAAKGVVSSKTETVAQTTTNVATPAPKPMNKLEAAKAKAMEAHKRANQPENVPESAKPKKMAVEQSETPFDPSFEDIEDDIIQ